MTRRIGQPQDVGTAGYGGFAGTIRDRASIASVEGAADMAGRGMRAAGRTVTAGFGALYGGNSANPP